MKTTISALTLLTISALAFGKEAWNDITKFKINKEEPCASYIVYPNFDLAKSPTTVDGLKELYATPSYKSLNGDWKFLFLDDHANAKSEYRKPDFNDADWDTLDVPNCWQARGYDTIFYANITLEFFYDKQGKMYPDFLYKKDNPKNEQNFASPWGAGKTVRQPKVIDDPYIPEGHHQMGIYRRNFVLPETWNGKQIFIQFDGVRTGFNLYINGKFVGYSEDSFSPAKFDITKYVKRGEQNTVVAEVYKHTTGEFMEIQDMPFFMGIIRDVVLMARTPLHIEDYYAPIEMSDDLKKADIDFQVKVQNRANTTSDIAKVDVYMFDMSGNQVSASPIFSADVPEIKGDSHTLITKRISLSNFKLWSPDKPNLYYLVLKLSDKNGKEMESIKADIGFKKLEIDKEKRQIVFNKKRFFIKGANHHDWSPDKAKAMSFDWMKKDILLMKQANMNAVRNSHYPKDSRFYMLCSRLGLFVLDEANHETHYFRQRPSLGDFPHFVPAGVDRMRNMVIRNRNVPCIGIFSVGNESACYYTESMKAMEQEARKLLGKAHIYIHSESEVHDIVNKRANGNSDFFSPMYGGIERMEEYLYKHTNETKPFFFCEYFHCRGNNMGDFRNTWTFIRSQESLNGGFIWDFVDQALYVPQKDDPTKTYLADERNWFQLGESIFWSGCDGVVFADRTYSAKYNEIKKVYQDIQIEQKGKCPCELEISNEFFDTNLNEFTPYVKVERNGDVVAEKYLDPISLAPAQKKNIKVILPDFDNTKAGDYYYSIAFLRKTNTPFANAGEVVAQSQFKLREVKFPELEIDKGQVEYWEDRFVIRVRTGNVFMIFDKSKCALSSYYVDGKELINGAIEFDYKSAYYDNYLRIGDELNKTKYDVFNAVNNSIKAKPEGDFLKIVCKSEQKSPNGRGFKLDTVYTIAKGGYVNVSSKLEKIGEFHKFGKKKEYPILPRIGLRMNVDKALDSVKFFGRGPFANYVDRLYSANVDMHELKVADFYENFQRPQDTGNREDVKFFALHNSKSGLLFSMPNSPNAVSVLPWTQDELNAVKYKHELAKSKSTDLRIAYQVAGLGSASCGPRPKNHFRIDPDKLGEWNFTIIPFASQKEMNCFMQKSIPENFIHKFNSKK